MRKIFITILRNRLLDWAEANSELCESQFGFRQGSQTTDAIFVTTTAIKSFKKQKKLLFTR